MHQLHPRVTGEETKPLAQEPTKAASWCLLTLGFQPLPPPNYMHAASWGRSGMLEQPLRACFFLFSGRVSGGPYPSCPVWPPELVDAVVCLGDQLREGPGGGAERPSLSPGGREIHTGRSWAGQALCGEEA